MSLFDFFKKGEETVTQEPMQESWQTEAGKSLAEYYQKYKDLYQPGADYSRLSEMMTPSKYEEMGLAGLEKYAGEGESDITTSLKDVLSKTLKGEYDPFTSKYYESLKRQEEETRQQSVKRLNQMLAQGGLGGTSYRMGKLGDIEQSYFDKISDVMASLQEKERERQLSAVTTGMQLKQLTDVSDINKLSTIMKLGALPRELESVGYKDFLRKQEEKAGVLNVGQNVFGTNIPYGVKSIDYATPSTFDTVLDYATKISQIVGNLQGGGGGGSGGGGSKDYYTEAEIAAILNKPKSIGSLSDYYSSLPM